MQMATFNASSAVKSTLAALCAMISLALSANEGTIHWLTSRVQLHSADHVIPIWVVSNARVITIAKSVQMITTSS